MQSKHYIYIFLLTLVFPVSIWAQTINTQTISAGTVYCAEEEGYIRMNDSEPYIEYSLIDADNGQVIDGPYSHASDGPMMFKISPMDGDRNIFIRGDYPGNLVTGFNGSNQFGNGGTDTRGITEEVTITAWINASRPNGTLNSNKFLGKYDGSLGFYLQINNDGHATLVGKDDVSGPNGPQLVVATDRNLYDGQWHMVTGVINGANSSGAVWELYVDGVLESSKSFPGREVYGLTDNTTMLEIGRIGQTFYYKGFMSDARLYSRALTAQNIQDLYNDCSTQIPDLVAHFPLDQRDNGNLVDLSASTMNATYIGYTASSVELQIFGPCGDYTRRVTPNTLMYSLAKSENEANKFDPGSTSPCEGDALQATMATSSFLPFSYYITDNNGNVLTDTARNDGQANSHDLTGEAYANLPAGNQSLKLVAERRKSTGIKFDGTNKWVNCNTNLRGVEKQVSLGVWFKTDYTNPSIDNKIGGHYDGARGYYLQIDRTGKPNVILRDGRSANAFIIKPQNFTKDIRDNEWHHLFTTIDLAAGRVNLFVDDSLVTVGVISRTGTFANTNVNMSIGRVLSGYFTGVLSHYYLFNTIEDTVDTYYDALPSITNPNLKAFYKLDEGAHDKVIDYSVTDIDGAIQRGVEWYFGKDFYGNDPFSCQVWESPFQIDVRPKPDSTISQNAGTLTANETGQASFLWLNCADPNNPTPISNERGRSFTPSQAGSYAVQITKDGCMAISNCVNVVISSVSEIKAKHQIDIFPNPARDQFQINFNGSQFSDLVIYDQVGKVVKTVSQLASQNTISTEQLVTGVYLLVLEDDNGRRVQQKLMVLK